MPMGRIRRRMPKALVLDDFRQFFRLEVRDDDL